MVHALGSRLGPGSKAATEMIHALAPAEETSPFLKQITREQDLGVSKHQGH